MKKNIYFMLALFAAFMGTASAQSWNLAGNAVSDTSKLGSTNALPVKFYSSNVERMRLDAAGRFGIGMPPVNILTVRSSGSNPSAPWVTAGTPVFMGFGEGTPGNSDFNLAMASAASNARGLFAMKRSRGTLAAPTAVVANDYLGSLLAGGYDGGTFQGSGAVDFFVDGAVTPGNVPARVSFVTGTNAGNRQERLRIGSTGNIFFNNNQLTLTQSTGNVSIGTGNLLMSSAARTIQFATPVASSAPMMTMFPSGTTNAPRMVLSHSPLFSNWGLQYVDSVDKFNFLSGGTSVLTADLGAQRVGIGTNAPSSKLDVIGMAGITTPVIEATTTYVGNSDVRGVSSLSHPADGYGYGVYATGGYRGGYFFGDGGSYSGGVAGVYGIASGDTGTRYGVYGIASGGDNNWGGYFPTKTYTNELRVGGLSGATGYVAAINGRLIATELRVEAIANWPDYVFGKNYKLMPLHELEAKIKTDKHLPGIPAAVEVKEKGIMVGEMQRKTIEKIEELTLYLIELSKENKELKARLEKLENK
jgi:hypothetical protein